MPVYKRGQHYHYDFTVQGRRFRGTTETPSKATAQRIADKIRDEAIESVRFGKKPNISLIEAITRYRLYSDTLPSAYTIAGQFEKLCEMGISLMFSQMSDATISDYIALRRGQKARNKDTAPSNATINNELTMLRALTNQVSTWGYQVPTINWKKLRLNNAPARKRYLSADEIATLLSVARPDFRPLIDFCLLTGARFGSAAALTWDAVDYDAEMLTFRTMKGGEPHTIPIRPKLRTMLANQRGKHPIFVFVYECQEDRPAGTNGVPRKKGEFYPYSRDGWRRVWARALKDAKIEGVRFHDLRHTAGSRVTRLHGIATARKMLGHSDITTTDRYSHVLMEDVGRAMEDGHGGVTQAAAPDKKTLRRKAK